jgi:hypothetical protein
MINADPLVGCGADFSTKDAACIFMLFRTEDGGRKFYQNVDSTAHCYMLQ